MKTPMKTQVKGVLMLVALMAVGGVVIYAAEFTAVGVLAYASARVLGYWQINGESSFTFAQSSVSRALTETNSPKDPLNGPAELGKPVYCNIDVAGAAPGDRIEVTISQEGIGPIFKNSFKVTDDLVGPKGFWMYSTVEPQVPGRYTCRFTHGEKAREMEFEVADRGV